MVLFMPQVWRGGSSDAQGCGLPGSMCPDSPVSTALSFHLGRKVVEPLGRKRSSRSGVYPRPVSPMPAPASSPSQDRADRCSTAASCRFACLPCMSRADSADPRTHSLRARAGGRVTLDSLEPVYRCGAGASRPGAAVGLPTGARPKGSLEQVVSTSLRQVFLIIVIMSSQCSRVSGVPSVSRVSGVPRVSRVP